MYKLPNSPKFYLSFNKNQLDSWSRQKLKLHSLIKTNLRKPIFELNSKPNNNVVYIV